MSSLKSDYLRLKMEEVFFPEVWEQQAEPVFDVKQSWKGHSCIANL